MAWVRDEEGKFREHKVGGQVETNWKQIKRTSQKVVNRKSKTRFGIQNWHKRVCDRKK